MKRCRRVASSSQLSSAFAGFIEGHAFIQNIRRGQYELGVDARVDRLRCAGAFDELASTI